MKKILVLWMAAAVITGCGTLDKTKLSDLNIRQKVEPLQLTIGYDIYLLRVDLRREHHTETRQVAHTDGKGMTSWSIQTVSVPNAYHYVVVDFGNGIIMDYNGNLCLDLARYYHFTTNNHFRVFEKPEGLFSSTAISDRTGDKFLKINHGIIETRSEADFSGNPIKINDGIFNSNLKLTVSSNFIDFDPSGFLGLGAVTISQPDQKTVIIPNFWQNQKFTMEASNLVTLNHQMDLLNLDDHLEIKYSGIFGYQEKYNFIKTVSGCYFYNSENFQGVEVLREGNKITVTENGSKVNTFTLDQI